MRDAAGEAESPSGVATAHSVPLVVGWWASATTSQAVVAEPSRRGRPLVALLQVAPPSVDLNTPLGWVGVVAPPSRVM